MGRKGIWGWGRRREEASSETLGGPRAKRLGVWVMKLNLVGFIPRAVSCSVPCFSAL